MQRCFLGLLTITTLLLAATLSLHAQKPQSSLERKAQASRGGNESQVRDLVDEVFRVNALVDDAGLLDGTKDRLTRAEVKFRQNQHKSIKEEDIANAVNHAAKKLNAPEYAYTSPYEVRRVRVGLFAESPHLVSKDVKDEKDAAKAFDSELSPVEAFHVAANLVHQKLINPDYQVTCNERRERWAEDHTARTRRPLSNERTQELHALVNKHAAQLSSEDAQKEADELLDKLGVER